MADRLRKYFPMIRTREEVIEEIQSKSELTDIFQRWTEEQQEEFLDFCTGIRIDLLQKYVFLLLDIFKEHRHNKTIRNKLDGWLTFFSTDEPETVERLIDIYPEFIPMYQEIYTICRNMENVMEFFSEELKILDRNTVLYMIDAMQDMQREIERLKALLGEK